MASTVQINSLKVQNVEFADNVENTIICNKLREDFIGMSTVFLGTQELICEHTEDNFVRCDVLINDKKYSNVPFKFIVKENVKPLIILNKRELNNPQLVQTVRPTIINEAKDNKELEIVTEKSESQDDDFILEIKRKEENIFNLKKEVTKYKERLKKEKVINEKRVFNLIDEKIDSAINEFKNTTTELLQNYLSNINTTEKQIKSQIRQQLEVLKEKLTNPNSYEGNKLIFDAIKNILEESETSSGGTLNKFRDKLLEDIRVASEQQLRNHTRQMQRYAEMVSGGGSVAKQLAVGGTIRGDLDVRASYLSGGRDLADIFAPSLQVLPLNNQILEGVNNKEYFQNVNQSVNFIYSNFDPGKTIVVTLSGTHSESEIRHFLPNQTYITGNNAIANTVFTFPNKITKLRITNVNGTYLGVSELIDSTATQIFRPNGNTLINEDGTFLLYESGETIFLE